MKFNIVTTIHFGEYMLLNQVNLFHIPVKEVLKRVNSLFPNHHYNHLKHRVIIEDEHLDTMGYIQFPLHLSIDKKLKITDEETVVLYLSIESGNAAICVMEGKQNVYHTTFSAYMTRKKQGFSQVKYLNKKGKSRAGSRIRLASTIGFFEQINTTLTDLFDEFEFARIALSCSTSLIPYLHQSKIPCPFDKKDSRLYKIPLHIPQSNYANLSGTIKKLMAPMLFYDEKYKDLVDGLE